MKRNNSIFFNSNNSINLKDYFPEQALKNVTRIFPQINNNFKIDKIKFYSMLIEKVKNYFELNEKFIIVECLSILFNDITQTQQNLISNNEIKITRSCSTKSNGRKKTIDKKKGKKIFLKTNTDLNSLREKEKKVHFIDTNNDKNARIFVSPYNNIIQKSSFKKRNNITKKNYTEKRYSYKTDFVLIRQKSNGRSLKSNYSTSIEKNKNQLTINLLIDSNKELLTNIENENFDIFNLDKNIGPKNTLTFISIYIYNSLNFNEFFKNQKIFENFCKAITEGYSRKNPYHTDLHAADITQTCFTYFKQGKINDICKLNNISICALFLSCICHDFKHPGVNNNYLKETNSSLAILYNDESILENMHISETFKLINSDNNLNIFKNVDKNIYNNFRKQMISCVLHTDMVKHNSSIDFMNSFIKTNVNDKNCCQEFLNLIIHSADISNPTKKYDIYYKWAKLVVEEFYEQGDKERKLGLKISCDRNITSLYKCQVGFIDYVEIPYFNLFVQVFPKLNYLIENLNENRKKLIEMHNEEK